ncbi:hypothetical protein HN836_00705, partial [Candidatus Woesearchaeota archaeon]|nr:hypothetical protein [Candidatus Woesearchaeota archaeon]
KKFKDKKINIILIDPAKLLLEKIILIEKGEMYHDPKMENENYTVIDLNEYELDITISKINMYGENLNDINFECDFLFSLTALQNVSNLNKIIEIIKNKKIKNFILSYLYRGKENELDKVIELFEKLEFKKLLKNNKDIFFVK